MPSPIDNNASILIPVRNEENHIARCLNSILKTTFPKNNLEIIIIDGMSEDNTISIVESLDWGGIAYTVVKNPARIVPTALNLGIKASSGKYIIRMDAHTIYAEDYVETCVKLLEQGIAENVGGPMRVIAKTPIERAVAAATSSRFGVGNAFFHFPNYKGYVDTVYLGAWPRTLFDEIGFFDEELVRNQDDEFNFRMALKGKKTYMTPEIKSWYHPRPSLKKLWRQYFQYGYWKFRVAQKHHGLSSCRQAIPAVFIAFLFLSFSGGLFSPLILKLFWSTLIFYSFVNILFSFSAFFRLEKVNPLLLCTSYITLHFSYGTGYWKGVWDFGLRNLIFNPREKSLSGPSAGSSPAVCIIGNFLSQTGHTPQICETLSRLFENEGVTVYYGSRFLGKFRRLADMFWTITVNRNRYSVILIDTFSGSAFTWAFLSGLLAHLLGKKYIAILHGGGLPDFYKKRPKALNLYLANAFKIVSPSPYLQRWSQSIGFPAQLVYNPIDHSRYYFSEKPISAICILWLRRFHSIYNPLLAIEVMKLLVSAFPEATMTMAGPDSGMRRQCIDTAEKSGLSNRILFPGFLSKENIIHAGKEHNIFLNTSDIDNAPVTLIEAAAMGLAVVSTNTGGIPDIFTDKETAMLSPKGDAQKIADCIIQLYHEPDLYRHIVKNAYKLSKKFDSKPVLSQWKKILASTDG